MKLLASAAIFLGLSAAGVGQVYDWAGETSGISSGYEQSKAICRSVGTRLLPPSDAPDAATAASLKGCDSEALYYGIGVRADPVRARHCAFVEREAGDDQVIGGSAMLMTIYANGVGAQRNLDVATHLACGIEGAPAESDGRVRHLAELRAKNWTGTDFHFCDDITSGFAMGYCAAHGARIEGAKRDAALAALMRDWSSLERAEFTKLQSAHAAFVEAHGGGEVDMGGTARAAMAVGAEEEVRSEFLEILQRLSNGTAPTGTAESYRAVDARLNAAYRKAMAEVAAQDYPGAVTQQGIRDAQRAWLRYRDGFLAFARVKYPALASDALAAWLTDKRTKMLLAEE